MSPSRKRVLVGDADEIVLALILHILQRQGFAVDVTTEVADFTQKARDGAYDALLVDPAISPGGAQWIRNLLAEVPDLGRRMIVLGSTEGDLPVRAALRKPVEFGLLIDTVDSCTKQ